MKKIPIVVAALIVVVAGYLYASPYLALNSIKNAIQTQDADTLSSYIDFPSVKQDFKDQAKAKFASDMMENKSNDEFGFEALGAMMGGAMIDTMIDGLVTPEGISRIMQEKQEEISREGGEADLFESVEYKTSYDSFNRFHVDIGPDSGKTMKIAMQRDGLSWKVTNIDLPLNDFR